MAFLLPSSEEKSTSEGVPLPGRSRSRPRHPPGAVRLADYNRAQGAAAAVHPNADEWQYFISGSARMTVFASSGKARTFDDQAGDVGVCPTQWASGAFGALCDTLAGAKRAYRHR